MPVQADLDIQWLLPANQPGILSSSRRGPASNLAVCVCALFQSRSHKRGLAANHQNGGSQPPTQLTP
jgi:hypothetical protein